MSRRHIEYYGQSPNAFGITLKAEKDDNNSPMYYGQVGQFFLHNICKNFLARVDQLQESKHYTPEGIRQGVHEAAKKALAEIKSGYKRFLDPLVSGFRSADTPKGLRPPADPIEAIERMELRSFLRSVDGGKRREIFDEALATNEEKTLAAFFHQSKMYQLLGSEILEAGKRQYLQRAAPTMLDAELSGSVLTYNIGKATEELSLFVLGTSEDALSVLQELPTDIGWSFTRTGDFDMIAYNRLPSNLPAIAASITLPAPK